MRKRSNYEPKAIVTPIMRSSLSPNDATNLKLMSYQALDLVTRGHGTYDLFDCLNMAVSVCTVLAEKGYGKEYMDVCRDAIEAIRRMGHRAVKTGKFGLDGEGYQAIKDCPDLHSQQIELCTRLTLSDAIFEVERRTRKRRQA